MDENERRLANEETHRAWNANAEFWDEQMGEGNDFVELLIWPSIKRLMELQAGERVLDIACGNGLYTRRLAEMGAEVVAFDFSDKLISIAKNRMTAKQDRIQYHVLDATKENELLALGEKEFDLAICNMALFDIADIQPLFHALTQLLKHKGRFIFSIIHPCFNNPHMQWVAEGEDVDGQMTTSYSVKIRGYMTPTVTQGAALTGQPKPQLYFHRSIQDILGVGFRNGFILDALEERAFPPGHPPGEDPLSWGGNFSEIPPVMIGRMVIRK